MIFSLYNSFYGTTLIAQGPFVGFGNYVDLILKDEVFRECILRTIYFVLVQTSAELALGIALGFLFNSKLRGVKKLRNLLIAPLMATPVVVAYMWKLIYFAHGGIINTILGWLGMKPIMLLSSELTAPPALMLVDIWNNTPFVAFIVIAGLQAIPEHLYDAAKVDGASPFQVVRHVSIPMLKPLIAIALLFTIMRPFWTFGLIYVMTEGGPGYATTLPSYLLFRYVFRYLDLSKGMAASYLFFILVVALSYFLIKRTEEYLEI